MSLRWKRQINIHRFAKKTFEVNMQYVIFFLLFFLPLSANEKKTICLNMIVKNEKDVIERCLNSVKPIIDYWVIVDTGSTDGTQEIIKEYMKDIPGELYERPWKNFSHNRNEALEFAKTKADYVLIMDADDILKFDPSFVLPELTYDAYRFQIRHNGTTFYRYQLINMSRPWKWEGVLHEYLFCPHTITSTTMDGVTYVRTEEGARSKDPAKYKKDVAVFEEALKEDPCNSRYVFYLAQSYRDAEEPEKAIEWYSKRVEMGGWEEEVFYSMYQIARMEEQLKKPIESVIASYYRAHRFRPHRPEPIYHLASIFRSQKQYALAYSIIRSRGFIPQPAKPDVLFVESWMDHYGFLIELSISSFHVGRYQESLDACDALLAIEDLPSGWRKQTQINREYATKKLGSEVVHEIEAA